LLLTCLNALFLDSSADCIVDDGHVSKGKQGDWWGSGKRTMVAEVAGGVGEGLFERRLTISLNEGRFLRVRGRPSCIHELK
jgi:hypothetical protein